MSDVDTGGGMGPLTSQVSGGFYWHKRSAAATGVYWVLRGDSKGFYISAAPNAASSPATSNGYGLYAYYAGDGNSYRSGDAWGAMLTGSPSATYSDTSGCVFTTSAATGMVLQRASVGIGAAQFVTRSVWGAGVSGADSSQGPFPSRADNGLRLSPIVISDGSMAANGPRGELPGAYHCTQTGVVAVMGADVSFTPGQGAFAGKQLQSMGCGQLAGAATGCGFVDVTGPWRD